MNTPDVSRIAPLAIVAALLGCSSGHLSSPITSDAGSDAGASDAGNLSDAGGRSDGGCTATADYGMVTPFNQYGEYDPADGGEAEFFLYQSNLNQDVYFDYIDMEIYPGYGAFANGLDAGTYTLAGDDLNYGTCGLCVLIFTNADSSGTPLDSYMATSGTVTISTFAPTIAGSFSNMTFRHVTIDQTTFDSTPADDSCTAQIELLDYSVADGD